MCGHVDNVVASCARSVQAMRILRAHGMAACTIQACQRGRTTTIIVPHCEGFRPNLILIHDSLSPRELTPQTLSLSALAFLQGSQT